MVPKRGASVLALILILSIFFQPVRLPAEPDAMHAYRALLWNHLEALCEIGPRYPGSEGHAATRKYIRDVAERYASSWQEQAFTVTVSEGDRLALYNYELTFNGKQELPPILIGAHYDTRPFADEETDPRNRDLPIVGANDGGSGTAILMGLAKYLHEHPPARPVKLIFFDGEDYGRAGSSDYFLGSTYYAEKLKEEDPSAWPHRVLVVDMVGEKDMKIFKEVNSFRHAPDFLDEVFQVAEEQGLSQFVPKLRYAVRDDHLPFLYRNIPSVLLIDFDYPHWHTLEDTLDKCSAESLFAVFTVVKEWLKRG